MWIFKKGFFLLFLLTACGNGQHLFYWERPETGAMWFARDHAECLEKSDFWPYTWPGSPVNWGSGYNKYNLRFDNNARNGIWAEFLPYPGAQPVYVNSLKGDWSMSPSIYEKCMEDRGYIQVAPASVNRQVFPE